MVLISNVLWIDGNIENEENSIYRKELESICYLKLTCFKNTKEAIDYLKIIEFVETKIIVSGRLYIEFIKMFIENIKEINVIPKIVIFTKNKDLFLENNKQYINYINHSFYNFGGIKILFEEVKDFLMNKNLCKKLNLNDENIQMTFEYIDNKSKLTLPLFYKTLIETSNDRMENYTNLLYEKYSKDNQEIKDLFEQIKILKDIPIELLSKYYIRAFTIESDFYYDINKDLGLNKKEKHLPFIKILYEAIKLKSLPLASNNILYRGAKINNDEINKINHYLKNKIPNLPAAIVFSKSFLSFSKDKKIAEDYLKNENENKKLSKVLYILEKDDNIDYSLSTHGDIEKISYYPKEKEVLFFPFSSFEIKDIKEIKLFGEKLYEIKLLYLGKYLKEIEKEQNSIGKVNNIPDSEFKKQIVDFGLVQPKKINDSNIKQLLSKYKQYKNEIKSENKIINNYNGNLNIDNKNSCKNENIPNKNNNNKIMKNINKKNEDNDNNNNELIIYKTENENKIKIFGKKFVSNNKDKCKIIYKNKKYELKEELYINSNNNIVKIDLIGIENITDMSHMFWGCTSLISLKDMSKWNTKDVVNMSGMFNGCSSLLSLPDISNWDTNNVNDMSCMFSGASSLLSLSDISKWNTNNVNNMSYMFENCTSLLSLPDISKWNTNKVTDMRYMFSGCSLLSYLPDIILLVI